MTRSQARSQTWSAAVRVLLSAQAVGELVEHLPGGVGVGGGVDPP